LDATGRQIPCPETFPTQFKKNPPTLFAPGTDFFSEGAWFSGSVLKQNKQGPLRFVKQTEIQFANAFRVPMAYHVQKSFKPHKKKAQTFVEPVEAFFSQSGYDR
jgi:hypothetical protein